MPKKEKVFLDWDGDHASLVSLFEVKSPDYLLRGLLACVHGTELRTKAGIRQSLLLRQAQALETHLLIAPLPAMVTESQVVQIYQDILRPLEKKGLSGIAFSDFDSKSRELYQRQILGPALKAFYPLAGWGSQELLRVFFSLGFRAIVCSVDLKRLPPPFVGRELDREFIEGLPSGIDPAGQNAEYSCFVYDGPFFQKKLELKKGQVFEREGRAFLDLE